MVLLGGYTSSSNLQSRGNPCEGLRRVHNQNSERRNLTMAMNIVERIDDG